MANRQEEKERLRAERLAAQASQAGSERRRLILGYVLAGLLTAAVIAGIVAVAMSGGGDDGGVPAGTEDCPEAHLQIDSGTPPKDVDTDCREGTPPPAIAVGDLNLAAKEAGCQLMLDLKDEGNTHLKPGAPLPAYKTNPPTSGNHVEPPLQAADGAYAGTPSPLAYVHSMEHGRVLIMYSSKLSEDEQLALKGVFDEDPDGILIFPNDEMPYEVAVVAWTQLVGCPTYSPTDIDVIRDFRDKYRGNGPEPVPISF